MKWDLFTWLLLDNAIKYFFISLPFFVWFYVLFKKRLSYKKIQAKYPLQKDYLRELGFSFNAPAQIVSDGTPASSPVN